MQLVADQQEPSTDGFSRQVERGSHDNSDDAEVDRGAWQRPRGAFKHLQGRIICNLRADTHTHLLLRSGGDTCYLEQQEGRGHGVQRVEVVCSAGTVQWEPVGGEGELHKKHAIFSQPATPCGQL